MILSMTGFGRSSATFKDKTISFEIRSLNGKQFDLRLKYPNSYKEKEFEMRNIVVDHAIRGKMDAVITVESESGDSEYALNKALFVKYAKELNKISSDLGLANTDIVQSVMRIPNVVKTQDESLDPEEWAVAKQMIRRGLEKLTQFRSSEGVATCNDLTECIYQIKDMLTQVAPHEEGRLTRLREKIKRNITELSSPENLDPNRFEQELLYYIERLDINEEKMRLSQHCDFFMEVLLDKTRIQKGKKLSFISQELGREINTLGSKAQYSDIQKLVVSMKDNLEKIKEQLANVI
jgi:uncharacterized protein (TIGR00255 family)